MTKRTTVPAMQDQPESAGLDAITAPTPNVLVQVPLALITAHPDNPRRDLGDLTELTDSIREHGVRQNLLLVPHPDDPTRYRVVIGHRRAAAAYEAGLEDVPAVIDPSLTPAKQLELMLLENLQRTDLSPVEEATGYQGLLDLGQTVAQVAKGTGRSAFTVKARVKLLTLPERARERIHTGQGTLDDAAALADAADVLDAEQAAAIADRIGDAGFRAELDRAVRWAKREAAIAPFLERIVALGMTKADGWQSTRDAELAGFVSPTRLAFDRSDDHRGLSATELTALLDEADATWVWRFSDPRWDDLFLYRPAAVTAEVEVDPQLVAEREADELARQERRREEDERRERCFRFGDRRLAWITDRVRGTFIAGHTKVLAGYAAILFGSEDPGYPDPAVLDPLIGFDAVAVEVVGDEEGWEAVIRGRAAALAALPVQVGLLAVLAATVESNVGIRTDVGGAELDAWYRVLVLLGYELSAEESAHVLLPQVVEPGPVS